ncbi:hypothetical protein N183_34565 [Sinorhizobium sp. Sb3]|nr:hypothetical protein N183_34565 [Sinorhizobium sp. Sb3]
MIALQPDDCACALWKKIRLIKKAAMKANQAFPRLCAALVMARSIQAAAERAN